MIKRQINSSAQIKPPNPKQTLARKPSDHWTADFTDSIYRGARGGRRNVMISPRPPRSLRLIAWGFVGVWRIVIPNENLTCLPRVPWFQDSSETPPQTESTVRWMKSQTPMFKRQKSSNAQTELRTNVCCDLRFLWRLEFWRLEFL